MSNIRNSFRFTGNIGQDAETKTTPGGTVVTFSVAVNEKWTDDKKIEHKRTDWFDVEVWGFKTRFAATLKKGTPVLIEGKVKTGSFKDKNGADHKTWVVKANSILKIDYSQPEDSQFDETSDANEDVPY